MRKRLAIVTTHPIQYNAPLFKLLAIRGKIQVKVFYTWGQMSDGKMYDPGFKKNIKWDIPLLEGYEYSFVKNVAVKPGSHHFKGIINPTLINEINIWKPDTILVYGWSFKSHLKCIRFFHKKIPIFFRGDSTLIDDHPGIKSLLRTLFLKWVYRNVDYALYVGTNNKKYFLKHGLKTEQLFFAPHAIDNSRFIDTNNVYKQHSNGLRNELGIPDNKLVFLYAGKLEPKKNIELLILSFISVKHTGVHLVIVGNGLLEKQLKSKYSNLKNIHFLDFQNQSQMPVIYNMCDVFILPSKGPGETWGLSVNEAMACSKPVIVSDKCGCAIDLVDEDVNGYMFAANNKQDLSNRLTKAISQANELKKMGEKSYNKIQNYTFQKMAEQIENMMLSIN